MSRADDLKVEYDVAIKVAKLEDELAELKAAEPRCEACGRRESGKEPPRLAKVKHELRDLRYVLRLGRQDDDESAAILAELRALTKEA